MYNEQQDYYSMKTLTLKSKKEKPDEKINKKEKHPIPHFKHFEITMCGLRTIGLTQCMFESLWSRLSKIDATKSEKEECLRHLKEACSWYSRGIAKWHRVKGEKVGSEIT